MATHGLAVGPRELLTLRTALAQPGDWTWKRLVRVVTAVVASSPAEVVQVQTALEAWRDQHENPPVEAAPRPTPAPAEPTANAHVWRRRVALAGVLFVLIVVGSVVYPTRPGGETPPEPPVPGPGPGPKDPSPPPDCPIEPSTADRATRPQPTLVTGDGDHVVVRDGEDIALVSIADDQELGRWSHAKQHWTAAAVSPDASHVAAADKDGLNLIPLTNEAEPFLRIHTLSSGDALTALAWSVEGSQLLYATRLEGLSLWDQDDTVQTVPMALPDEAGGVRVAAQAEEGHWLVGTDRGLLLRFPPSTPGDDEAGAPPAELIHQAWGPIAALQVAPSGAIQYSQPNGAVWELPAYAREGTGFRWSAGTQPSRFANDGPGAADLPSTAQQPSAIPGVNLVATLSAGGQLRLARDDGQGWPTILTEDVRGAVGLDWSRPGTLAAFSEQGRQEFHPGDAAPPRRSHGDSAPPKLAILSAPIPSPDGVRIAQVRGTTVAVSAIDAGTTIAALDGHDGPLNYAAFSPDGLNVVTASEDGTARVWSVDGSGEVVVLQGHQSAVVHAEFSPNGSKVVTASKDGTARVWAADGSGEATVLRGHEGEVRQASFSQDGSRVVTASEDGTARVWSADGGGEPVVLRGHEQPLSSAAFSPDGSKIVTGPWDTTARVWSASGTGEPVVLRGHEFLVMHASFSPDGSRVVTASRDGTARVWSASGAGAPVVLRGHEQPPVYASFSPDGSKVVTAAEDHTARVWASDGGGEPVVLLGHEQPLSSASFSPDGSRVVTASLDGTARVWSADGSDQPVVLAEHADWVSHAAFSRDGGRVVTASRDGTARVWAVGGPREPVALDHGDADVSGLAFTLDGSVVATADTAGAVRLWSSDHAGAPLVLSEPGDGPATLAISPEGRRVVAALPSGVQVWPADGEGEPWTLDRPDLAPGPLKQGAIRFDDIGHMQILDAEGTTHSWVARVPHGDAAFSSDGTALHGTDPTGTHLSTLTLDQPPKPPAPVDNDAQNRLLLSAALALALPLLWALLWVVREARRRIRYPLPEPHPVRLDGDPSRFWLPARDLDRPVLISRKDRDDLTRGLGSYQTDRPSRRLDVAATITANLGPEDRFALRFVRRRQRKRALLLLDQRTRGLLPRRLVEELQAALGPVDCETATFVGWPDQLRFADGRVTPLVALEDDRNAMVIVVVSDASALTRRGVADDRVRMLRLLGEFPRTAWAHPGGPSARRSWSAMLRPHGMACIGLDQVSGFLASGGMRVPKPANSPGLTWLWAACCALSPLPVQEETALTLRASLGLPVSALELHALRAASVHPQGIQFSQPERAALLNRLGAAFGLDGGAPEIVQQAVAFWKARLIGGDTDTWRTDASGPGVHRRLLLALLDLWVDPTAAGATLFALQHSPYFHRIEKDLAQLKTADNGTGGIDLPFRLDELDPTTAEKLARVGLAGTEPALVPPPDLSRPAQQERWRDVARSPAGRWRLGLGAAGVVAAAGLTLWTWARPEPPPPAAVPLASLAGETFRPVPGDAGVPSFARKKEDQADLGPLAYALESVTFADGATATGSFRYDPVEGDYVSAEITITGPVFGSAPHTLRIGQDTLKSGPQFLDLCEGTCGGGARYFRLSFTESVSEAAASIGIVPDRRSESGSFYGRGAFADAQPVTSGRIIRAAASAAWGALDDPVTITPTGHCMTALAGTGAEMTFVELSPGQFTMGSPHDLVERHDNEGPQHRVRLSGYAIGRTEVTQAQWETVRRADAADGGPNPWAAALPAAPSKFSGETLPVEQVDWCDALRFANALSAMEGRKVAYELDATCEPEGRATWRPGADGYRLPTAAEWEAAARAGTTGRFWSGDSTSDLRRAGWVGANSGGRTHPVCTAAEKKNPWGLCDVLGNVHEWAWDVANRDYSAEPLTDPSTPRTAAGGRRVVRGGSWRDAPRFAHSAYRGHTTPDDRVPNVGFRLVAPTRLPPRAAAPLAEPPSE